jgi:DNA-binding transcriptional regulator YiaG
VTAADIRRLRQREGLTQEQFARLLGVTWTTISRWENGKSKPSPLAVSQLTRLNRRKR